MVFVCIVSGSESLTNEILFHNLQERIQSLLFLQCKGNGFNLISLGMQLCLVHLLALSCLLEFV